MITSRISEGENGIF